MKFESMRAWDEALAMARTNLGVALPLAGVFFALPSLVVSLFAPRPEIVESMTARQQLEVMAATFQSGLAYTLPAIVVQQAGILALLTLFADRSRPTVGEAIEQGFSGLLANLAAMLILAVGFGLAGGLFVMLGALSGSAAVIAATVGIVLGFAVAVGVRTSLVAPVIAIERTRNPVAALTRSWNLTQGNTWRLLAFYLLLGLAYILLLAATVGVIGVLATLLGGARAGEVTTGVIEALIGALALVVQAAILAAIHRQLAGPSRESLRSTFD